MPVLGIQHRLLWLWRIHTGLVRFRTDAHEIRLTFGELQVDEHGGDCSESNSQQLSELVVREVLNRLRGHIFGLLFVTKDCSEEIVTGVVKYRAQESRAKVADEESRGEGKRKYYVVGGKRHRAMFSPIHIHARHPDPSGHVMIILLQFIILRSAPDALFASFFECEPDSRRKRRSRSHLCL